MKKSILASLFAGLFAVSAVAGDHLHKIKVDLKKEDGANAVVNVNHNGDSQVFEFTEDELQDTAAIENRLANLDEETRNAVMGAIKGVALSDGNMLWVDGDVGDGENKMVFVRKFKDGQGDGELHKMRVELKGDGAHDGKHKFIKFGHSEGNSEEHDMKLHHGPDSAAKVIEMLLKDADLTQEQLDQIQESLDSKRAI